MIPSLTKRLPLLATVLFLPGFFLLSWWAWMGLEDNRQVERNRIRHFEELAASHVVNNLGSELFHLDYSFRLGVSKASREGVTDWPRRVETLIDSYQKEAHFSGLLKDAMLVSDRPDGERRWLTWSSDGWTPSQRPRWFPVSQPLFDQPADPGIDLENPVMVVTLPTVRDVRQVLVLRYDVDKILSDIAPGLAGQAFEERGASLTYEVSVFRRTSGSGGTNPPADLVVPLVPRAHFSDWLRNYLDRSPAEIGPPWRVAPYLRQDGESLWMLRVKLLPSGLGAYVSEIQRRNFLWAVALFLVSVAGFALFLLSVLGLVRAARREKAFTTLVSHELKTPVAAILSLSENLAGGVVVDPARVRDYGGLIVDQSHRLGGMIANILALASLEGTSSSPVREDFDAADLAREAAASAGLSLDPGSGSWMVRGNRAAVRAALDNLVTNAFRHGVREGEAARVSLGLLRERGRWIGVSVTDHGPGLEGSPVKTLFEPYRRGLSAQRRQLPGSGIGLSLVRATMVHLGGRVQVQPVPGGGLCFTLWLREGGAS